MTIERQGFMLLFGAGGWPTRWSGGVRGVSPWPSFPTDFFVLDAGFWPLFSSWLQARPSANCASSLSQFFAARSVPLSAFGAQFNLLLPSSNL